MIISIDSDKFFGEILNVELLLVKSQVPRHPTVKSDPGCPTQEDPATRVDWSRPERVFKHQSVAPSTLLSTEVRGFEGSLSRLPVLGGLRVRVLPL